MLTAKVIANSKAMATASVARSVILTLISLLILRFFDIEACFFIAIAGMILAGVSPMESVQLQIVLRWMLIGAAAFPLLSSGFLAYIAFCI